MTIDQIRIFLTVAELEHVTRAAERLNLTQSAVSAAVSALEARHGVALFDRIGRRIRLSEAGRLFRDEAAAVLRQVERAEQLLADIRGGVAGILRLRASQTVASYWLPPRLVRFHEQHPGVTLDFVTGNTATVAQAVRDGVADVGVVEGRADLEGLESEVVASDQIVAIVGRRHPWASGAPVTARDLSLSSWIMREPGSGTRSAFEDDIRAMGVDPAVLSVVVEMPSNEACLAAVEHGLSATVLSRRAVEAHLGIAFVEVGLALPSRHYTALWHSQRHPSRALEAVLDVLRAPEA